MSDTDSNTPISGLPSFFGWNAYTPVIPKLYWDIYSQEERIKRLCLQYDKLCHYASAIAEKENVTSADVDNLISEFETFKASGFYDYYEAQIKEWVENNLAYLYNLLATQVYFGLTDDGRFCAFVPQSWNDIVFDTGVVYGTEEYGRLILRFDATGTNIINNTADNISLSSLVSKVGNISTNVDKLNVTTYTPLTKEG
jgi:hypothetical protein